MAQGQDGLFRILRMVLVNLVPHFFNRAVRVWGRTAFPDRQTSTHPALHTSAFLVVLHTIARAGPYRSSDNPFYYMAVSRKDWELPNSRS